MPWIVAILGGAIGAILVGGMLGAAGVMRPTTTIRVVERQAVAGATPVASRADQVDVPQIAERVRPAIVQVKVDDSSGGGSASGVVFQSDGHILTNHHVVSGARTVQVIQADGRELDAKVVGGDPDTDIAVLKVEGGGDMTTAVLGSARDLRVGELAIAIGSPLGLAGGPSVSVGVVSALSRQVAAGDGRPLLDMIQTDAPIAPGSSGGALLDGSGAVIGITTAIAVDQRTGAEGLGFATPVDIARYVAEQLIRTGAVVHVWLGIEGEDIDQGLAERLGVGAGAVVKKVRDGSPAAAAGLVPGDVITTIDGAKVRSMAGLVVSLRSRRPGQVVRLQVMRGAKSSQIQAVLTERPPGRR